jgi:cytochrome c2
MRRHAAVLAWTFGAHLLTGSVAWAASAAGDYLVNCQGCHKENGSGQRGYVPDFRGSVARFLALPQGRAYLGRVPGTAQSFLGDAERAGVLNWIVTQFDPEHLPANFVPYSAKELATYRQNPLSQASVERARVLSLIAESNAAQSQAASTPSEPTASGQPAQPSIAAPPQFALCAACHPTSTDGASAMGPNLRGVVGRKAGALSGFAYSPAMRKSAITWTREEIDAYLLNVQQKVPGAMMTLATVPNSADRAAIIAYLESLR